MARTPALWIVLALLAALAVLGNSGCGKDEAPAQLAVVQQFHNAFNQGNWDSLITSCHSKQRDALQRIRQQYGDRVLGPSHNRTGGRLGTVELTLVGKPEKRGNSVRVRHTTSTGASSSTSGIEGEAIVSKDGDAWKVIAIGGMRVEDWLLD